MEMHRRRQGKTVDLLGLQRVQEELSSVQKTQAAAESGFASLVAYFGENPTALPSDASFWQPIAAFSKALGKAQTDSLKARNSASKQQVNVSHHPGSSEILVWRCSWLLMGFQILLF